MLDAPSGPVGRRSCWHQFFSRFDLSVGYVPGKNNTVANVLSRFAYPASEAYRDISKHGSAQDEEERESLILRERMKERGCMYISAREGVELSKFPGGSEERWECYKPPSSQKWVRPDQPLPPVAV